jgi:ABC-2 type transport system permease protein
VTATTASRPRTGTKPPKGSAGPLTGTRILIRFMLRRDRIRIPAWALGLMLFTVGTAGNLATLYASAADRQAIAATMDSPAGIAMVGVNYGPDDYHFGVMMGHQMLWATAILVGVMSVLLVVRHTRLEEATGRAELVRAGVVGRHAMTAAALAVAAVANIGVGVLLAAGLSASGLEGITSSGSWLYGAAHAAVGLVFAAIAAVTVQITEHSRGASGMAMAAIGLSYAVRAVGDVSAPALSWLSPIGWAQATQVYVNDRWWPLLVAVVVAAVMVAIAVNLSTRRDVGAGLRRPRPGAAQASELLVHPVGFALRLHRANLIGWSVSLFLLGIMYGSVLGDVEQMLTDIEGLEDFLPEFSNVNLTETFAAMITTVLAIIAAIYAVLAAMKLRSEESAGRAEPVLATGLSQPGWIGSHLVVVLGGSVAVLFAGGLGIGLASAASMGDWALLPKLVGASVAYAPALWVTVGVAVALFGLLPRAITVTWALVFYSFVVVYLGGMLQFPEWTRNLSPFGHVPQLPAESFDVAPLAALSLVAAGLIAVGIAAFRRRDLQSST